MPPAGAGDRRPLPGTRPAGSPWRHRAAPARAVGVAVDQHPDHVGDIVRRTGQPVLQRQEVGPHVLGGAGDEAQDLGQPAQHLHLLGAGTRVLPLRLPFSRLSRRARRPRRPCRTGRYGSASRPRRPTGTHHGVAIFAPRLEGRQHRRKCSSRNSIVATTMSPRAMSARTVERGGVAAPFGGRVHRTTGPASARQAWPPAPPRRRDGCPSSRGRRDWNRVSGRMRFGIVQCLDGDRGEPRCAA